MSTCQGVSEMESLDVRGHHLLCAVCVRGGCRTPPPGMKAVNRLLRFIGRFPYAPLRITADADLIQAHYFDVYAGRGHVLPKDFAARSADHVARLKDLEVCRRLGIYPNTVLPAYEAYRMLFRSAADVRTICGGPKPKSKSWPACPHATKGYFDKVQSGGMGGSLGQQTALGEKSKGIWLLLPARTRAAMARAKERSARFIMEKADRLFIRPAHLLCILCASAKDEPLIEDNLVELRKRMEADPSIPVTLSEGCCMVCDACNVYHPSTHVCYHAHFRNGLRDLMFLRILDLKPGDTLPAGELYARIYERLGKLGDVCQWGDGLVVTQLWSSCGGAAVWPKKNEWFESIRARRLLAGGRKA